MLEIYILVKNYSNTLSKSISKRLAKKASQI